ncbi:MAG: hypothetical protein ACLP9S_12355 [Syntrophales bacterium]|jgi:hypothetical protein
MKMSSEKKVEETLKNNRTHSGEPPGVTDKITNAPSPGGPGMRILSRYSMTVDTLMKAVEIACI